MTKHLVGLLAVSLVGCAQGHTSLEQVFSADIEADIDCTPKLTFKKLPIKVEISADMSEHNIIAAYEAADAWTSLADKQVFEITEVDVFSSGPGIHIEENSQLKPEQLAWTKWRAAWDSRDGFATIEFSPEATSAWSLMEEAELPVARALTMAHEFGHAMGFTHEDDKSSLMYKFVRDPEHVSGKTRCLFQKMLDLN